MCAARYDDVTTQHAHFRLLQSMRLLVRCTRGGTRLHVVICVQPAQHGRHCNGNNCSCFFISSTSTQLHAPALMRQQVHATRAVRAHCRTQSPLRTTAGSGCNSPPPCRKHRQLSIPNGMHLNMAGGTRPLQHKRCCRMRADKRAAQHHGGWQAGQGRQDALAAAAGSAPCLCHMPMQDGDGVRMQSSAATNQTRPHAGIHTKHTCRCSATYPCRTVADACMQ